MRYYSLNRQTEPVDFRAATIAGQAPDGGLYFPETIPRFPAGFVEQLPSLAPAEVAYTVLHPYVGTTIPEAELRRICAEAVDFPFPLVPVTDRISTLELFHGPTLAFKDVGARFMSRCLGHFSRHETKPVTVLVATSGDTGGAVASGFLGVPGVEVVILYPSGKVSPVQEQQLTALGQNITALEVNGNFDDCQRLVKQAFRDQELMSQRRFTSANSINVARWLPQQVYYCYALAQWPSHMAPPVVAVPSGNFGNLCAGLLAYVSGLPVAHFVAACNANDAVPAYLRSGSYAAQPAVATLSNAMDVGDPSNFGRILELFAHDYPTIRELLTGYSVSDADTSATIRRVHAHTGYLTDPHGAVAYFALEDYLKQHPEVQGIFLETAHPVKFPEAVEPATGQVVPVPAALHELLSRTKRSIRLEPEYEALRAFLLEKR
ncbi:threonine synthase [Hymenobacter gelipurpurascens]|uniref:Threonine synthase n=1 Tax=Hymenobacter gelipurpurascens TaxID=89968 RepID=A0A212UET7_9BACT|nr:threonine synthase [Hymenobacter gelipurpurascens]SNC76759.1 threonine synthase [Hymenobacter gelipurpurascens]